MWSTPWGADALFESLGTTVMGSLHVKQKKQGSGGGQEGPPVGSTLMDLIRLKLLKNDDLKWNSDIKQGQPIKRQQRRSESGFNNSRTCRTHQSSGHQARRSHGRPARLPPRARSLPAQVHHGCWSPDLEGAKFGKILQVSGHVGEHPIIH